MRKSWFDIDQEERAKNGTLDTDTNVVSIAAPKVVLKVVLPSDAPIKLNNESVVYSPCTICYYSHHGEICDYQCPTCNCTGSHSHTCRMYENPQKLLISLNVSCTNLKLDMDELPADIQKLVSFTKKFMKDKDIKSCLFPHVCRVCSKFHEDGCKSNCHTCHKRGYHLKTCGAKPSNARLIECIVARSTMLFGKVLKIAQEEINTLSEKK